MAAWKKIRRPRGSRLPPSTRFARLWRDAFSRGVACAKSACDDLSIGTTFEIWPCSRAAKLACNYWAVATCTPLWLWVSVQAPEINPYNYTLETENGMIQHTYHYQVNLKKPHHDLIDKHRGGGSQTCVTSCGEKQKAYAQRWTLMISRWSLQWSLPVSTHRQTTISFVQVDLYCWMNFQYVSAMAFRSSI